ncbi:hypothetical protein [Brevibacillus sp. HD1.4A]|uniref:BC1872 family protein n=1 Tax=Brevibacillus sp. HD1.4A TaxID=2738978 RepID=UPI00156B48E3|nr:hypothetical protein [Brevibacillus sp. HD1.4A]NRQ51965.1 hypothetical protein [Brevibacillus sp. HD1.4A]
MTEQKIVETLATRVMGWELDNRYFIGATRHECFLLPDGNRILRQNWNPLQNIADAWALVEKFEHYRMQSCANGQKYCEFLYEGHWYGGHGFSQQEAICQAAINTARGDFLGLKWRNKARQRD